VRASGAHQNSVWLQKSLCGLGDISKFDIACDNYISSAKSLKPLSILSTLRINGIYLLKNSPIEPPKTLVLRKGTLRDARIHKQSSSALATGEHEEKIPELCFRHYKHFLGLDPKVKQELIREISCLFGLHRNLVHSRFVSLWSISIEKAG